MTGSIAAFAGPKSKVPEGWVVCDGTLYKQTDAAFKALFDVIGTTWGGDGVDMFAVPDLRGFFLRGVSETTDRDPDKAKRATTRPDLRVQGNSGNDVGSIQGHVFESHDHGFLDPGHSHAFGKGGTVDVWGGNLVPSGQIMPDRAGSSRENTGIRFHAQGGSETRPSNANVYFIIHL